MAVSEQLKTLVDQMPNADGRGMYCTDIDKEKIEKAIAQIHQGGKENVLGLIDMLGGPGSDQDVKPHYALQCLANHVLQSRDEQARREFAEVLAGQLGSERSEVHPRLFVPGTSVGGPPRGLPGAGQAAGRRRPGRTRRDGLGGHP